MVSCEFPIRSTVQNADPQALLIALEVHHDLSIAPPSSLRNFPHVKPRDKVDFLGHVLFLPRRMSYAGSMGPELFARN
jgi:hypothetical protein